MLVRKNSDRLETWLPSFRRGYKISSPGRFAKEMINTGQLKKAYTKYYPSSLKFTMKRVQGEFWSHSVRKSERTSSKQPEESISNAADQVKSQNKLHLNNSASNSRERFRNTGSSNRGLGLSHNSTHSAGRGHQTNYGGAAGHSHRHMTQPFRHDGRSAQFTRNNPPQRVQSAPLAAGMARASSRQWPCDNTHFMSKPGQSRVLSQGRSTQPPGNAGVSQAGELKPHRQIGHSHGARFAQERKPVRPVRGQEGSKKPAQQETFVPQSSRHGSGLSQGPNFATPTRPAVKVQSGGQTARPMQAKCGAAWLPNRHFSPSHSQFANQTQSHGASRHVSSATPQAKRYCPPMSQAERPHEVVKPTQPCFTSLKNVGRKWSRERCHWHGQQSFRFKVVSYNVLADHLLHSNKNLYRSCAGSWLLEWEYRKKNLLQELLHYQADILCLQEVQEEHFHDWFQPKLEQAGYIGLYKKRTGDKPDGCATFFKNSAFTLVSSRLIEFKREGVPFMDRDNIAIIALLRPSMRQAGSKLVAVANTHLLFNKKRGDIKLAQLACLLAELDEISKVPPPKTSSRKGGSREDTTQHCPIILCGDFNCTPFNPLYDFVTKGKLNYHGLSKIALSGQSSHQSFPTNSLLFTNVIPWELGISLSCKKRQDPGDVSTPSQQDFVPKANERVGLEEANVQIACQGSEITQMPSNTDQHASGNPDMLALYKSCTSIEHGLQLQSVYQHYFPDGQPEVTTFHDSACCTVDYIHYSASASCKRCKDTHGQLELSGKLSLLTEGQINSSGGLPSSMLSSDHLSLGAVFVLHV